MLAPASTFLFSAAGYLGFAEMGYRLEDASSGLASFWPSAGLIVGLLIRLPARLRVWCAVAVFPSEVAIDSIHQAPIAAGLGWGAVEVAELVTAAAVLVLVAGRLPRGDALRDFLGLAVAAFTVPAVTGLAGGAVSHAAFGGPFLSAWLTWWLSDATGILLAVPLVLALARPWRPGRRWQRIAGPLGVSAVTGVAGAVFVFGRAGEGFLVLPPLVLLAVTTDLRLTSIATVLCATVAAILTGTGHGPIASITNTTTRVLALDVFIATTAFVAFLISASIAERRQAEQKAAELATHDPLTGLANRRLFLAQLELVARRSGRSTERAGLLYCDLDGFKDVNDNLGHAAGDALLVEIGARLCGAVRTSDLAARMGGDEFAVLLEPVDGISGVELTARRVAEMLERPFDFGQVLIPIRISVGVALVGRDPDTSLAEADADLYRDKAEHRRASTSWPAVASPQLAPVR